MRVECESCRELVVASFSVGGGAVRATCPTCHHVTSAAAARVARTTGSPYGNTDAIEATMCPKCGAPRRQDATACSACGLLVSRIAAYTAARDASVADPVRDAWAKVAEAWSDDAAHDELLRLVTVHSGYAWAAGRYRTRGNDPVAVHQLERLRRAAEATLLAGATVRPAADASPYRATSTVLAMLVVVIAAGVLYAFVVRDRPSARTGAAAPAPAAVRPLVPGHPVSPSTIK